MLKASIILNIITFYTGHIKQRHWLDFPLLHAILSCVASQLFLQGACQLACESNLAAAELYNYLVYFKMNLHFFHLFEFNMRSVLSSKSLEINTVLHIYNIIKVNSAVKNNSSNFSNKVTHDYCTADQNWCKYQSNRPFHLAV